MRTDHRTMNRVAIRRHLDLVVKNVRRADEVDLMWRVVRGAGFERIVIVAVLLPFGHGHVEGLVDRLHFHDLYIFSDVTQAVCVECQATGCLDGRRDIVDGGGTAAAKSADRHVAAAVQGCAARVIQSAGQAQGQDIGGAYECGRATIIQVAGRYRDVSTDDATAVAEVRSGDVHKARAIDLTGVGAVTARLQDDAISSDRGTRLIADLPAGQAQDTSHLQSRGIRDIPTDGKTEVSVGTELLAAGAGHALRIAPPTHLPCGC